MRTISDDGLELVKQFEGLQLRAYLDEAGVWTIGWGHTGLRHEDGTVYKGRAITEVEAVDLLRHDMNVFAADVDKLIQVPTDDDEFAALVAFDFNTGGLHDSTLRRLLNAGHPRAEVAEQFVRWNKCRGKVLRGLTRRRLSEHRLFLSQRPFIVTMEELAEWEEEHKTA